MGEGWLMGEERRITEAEEVGKRKRNDLTLKVMGWGEGGGCTQGAGKDRGVRPKRLASGKKKKHSSPASDSG